MEDKKNSFTTQTWFVVLMFFFIWTTPVGLYYMHKNKMFSKVIRQIITSLTVGTLLVIIANFFLGELEVPKFESKTPVIEKTEN
ncbi:MAG: hypothetical protein ACRCZ2_08610 [Fusobacteriaceae bacterium]